MRKDKNLYSITVSELQDVAIEYLDRELTEDELLKVADKMCDYINWSDGVCIAIDVLGLNSNDENDN
jgi:hypothetical protein